MKKNNIIKKNNEKKYQILFQRFIRKKKSFFTSLDFLDFTIISKIFSPLFLLSLFSF